eukprot:15430925-Alexandrium_andersonii.AAC.1
MSRTAPGSHSLRRAGPPYAAPSAQGTPHELSEQRAMGRLRKMSRTAPSSHSLRTAGPPYAARSAQGTPHALSEQRAAGSHGAMRK